MIKEDTTQKMKFSIRNFFSKCDQIRSFLRIWPNSLEKSLVENLNFCALRHQQLGYVTILYLTDQNLISADVNFFCQGVSW